MIVPAKTRESRSSRPVRFILCVAALSYACQGVPATPDNGLNPEEGILIGYAILYRDDDRIVSLPRGCTPEEIRGFLFQVAEEKVPFHGGDGAQLLADACGEEALPPLLDLLKPETSDEPETPRQRRVRHLVQLTSLLCLGKIGASETTPHIVEFIEGPKEVPYKEAYDLITRGMYTLAHIGDDKALDYVDRMMTPEYWQERAENPRYARESWLQKEIERQSIRKWTIQALSISGQPGARERLIRVSERSDCEFSDSDIQTALDYWEVSWSARQKREEKNPG